MGAGRTGAGIDRLLWLAAALLLLLAAAAPVMGQGLTSLNQTGDTRCASGVWLDGSTLNAANHAIAHCNYPFASTAVPFGGASGLTQDAAHLNYDGTKLTVPNLLIQNVLSCNAGGKTLGTDGSGNVGCFTMTCTATAPSCSCTAGTPTCSLH